MWSINERNPIRNLFDYIIWYENNQQDDLITRIELYQKTDASFILLLTSPNAEAFEQVQQRIQERGFARALDGSVFKSTLKTQDVALLTNFVQLIKGIQPNFIEIEAHVCTKLHVDIMQVLPIPATVPQAPMRIPAVEQRVSEQIRPQFYTGHQVFTDISQQRIIIPSIPRRASMVRPLPAVASSSHVSSPIIPPLASFSPDSLWKKQGNFGYFPMAGASLNRQLQYHAQHPELTIQKLSISGYSGGTYAVFIKVKNTENYDHLDSVLRNAHFPPQESMHKMLLLLDFSSDNLSHISAFIQCVGRYEPHLQIIYPDIASTVGLNLNVEHIFSSEQWCKTGNFSIFHRDSADLIHCVSYQKGISSDTLIQEIQLKGYRDNTFRLLFKTVPQHHQTVIERAGYQRAHQPWLLAHMFEQEIRYDINTYQGIIERLRQMATIDPAINTIIEELNTVLISMFARTTTQHQTSTATKNFAQQLADINFPEACIPEEFICPISMQMITIPEYDARQKDMHYEASNIRRWVSEQHTNPFTRATLEVNMLKRNEALEIKINQFIESVLNSQYFIEHRHEHPALQHAYDKKFGIMPKF